MLSVVSEKDMSIEGKIGEKEPKRSTTVENVRQITPFYAKQTQFYVLLARKRRFHQKTNPIQTQLKPKQTQLKPKQTQFKPNFFRQKNDCNRFQHAYKLWPKFPGLVC